MLRLLTLFFTLTYGLGLKDYPVPHPMYMGTAVKASMLQAPIPEPLYVETLTREYNMMTLGNAMKWAALRPSETTFDFTQADNAVSYALKNCKKVRGHNLLWASYNPRWLVNGKYTASQLRTLLANHIQTVMTHYKTKYPNVIPYWDVVNEIINTGSGVWAPIGSAYTISALAFTLAHQADPTAKLCLNEYNLEKNVKSTGTYTLVESLVKNGIPIHCVGSQGHIRSNVDVNTWATALRAFTDLGLEVQITEFDIPNASPTAYSNALTACLHNSNCTAFISWGFTDKYTWLGTNEQPLPFDVNYNPKPAYHALQTALTNTC